MFGISPERSKSPISRRNSEVVFPVTPPQSPEMATLRRTPSLPGSMSYSPGSQASSMQEGTPPESTLRPMPGFPRHIHRYTEAGDSFTSLGSVLFEHENQAGEPKNPFDFHSFQPWLASTSQQLRGLSMPSPFDSLKTELTDTITQNDQVAPALLEWVESHPGARFDPLYNNVVQYQGYQLKVGVLEHLKSEAENLAMLNEQGIQSAPTLLQTPRPLRAAGHMGVMVSRFPNLENAPLLPYSVAYEQGDIPKASYRKFSQQIQRLAKEGWVNDQVLNEEIERWFVNSATKDIVLPDWTTNFRSIRNDEERSEIMDFLKDLENAD